ncbi:MAG: SGNH/GDSL hydrolase family protein [Mariniphaga sp.]
MKKIILLIVLFSPVFGLANPADSLKYTDALALPVIGKGFTETQNRYERLPLHLEGVTREPVWNLSKHSSGLAVRFRTNSTTIAAKWEVTNDAVMNHFAMTGIKGLDLYCYQNGKWLYVRTARPTGKESSAVIIENMQGTEMEYMLYLPLYDGIEKLEIGVAHDSDIKPPVVNSPQTGRPIVFYGTSITQGGCASRPGMSYSSILSRMLNRETVNLGFSGNGQLDYEIAEAMATIPAACIVMDCLPNVTLQQINEKYIRFLDILREKHPKTPIFLVENINYPFMYFDQQVYLNINEKNKALSRIFKEQKKKGDKNIFYIKADNLVGDDQEVTVDGIHLTDLGFLRMAENLYPMIQKRIK